MRKNSVLFKAFATVAIGLALTSCTDKIVEEIQPEEQGKGALPENIIAILPQSDDTRVTHTPVSGTKNVKVEWVTGDKITISPAHISKYANVYELVTKGEGGSGTFQKQSGDDVKTNTWGIYYPGDKIKSDVEFYNFTYKGQIQKKSSPTGHMAEYHSMMLSFSGSGVFPKSQELNFSGAEQSSCIHLILGGQTFVNPTSISLTYVNQNGFVEPVFCDNNVPLDSYYRDESNTYNGKQTTSTIRLGLEGYGTETELDAYMMTSNYSELPAGGYLLIKVKCKSLSYFCRVKVSADITLSKGKVMTITSNGKWYEDNVPYDDTTYSYDGEVVTVNEPNPSGGLDLIVMGDGFIASDFGNGTYEAIMKQAIEEFFAIQPIKQFRDKFNVYYVKAVSPQRLNPSSILTNGATGNGCITKFNTVLTPNTTSITGNHALVEEYAKKALTTNTEKRLKNATIVVMANIECHAGTCWNFFPFTTTSDYGEALAIAYCPLGRTEENRKQVMYHEICGHGFGKLGDEYFYSKIPVLSDTKIFDDLKNEHAIGYWRNVDCYIDSDFKSKYSAYATWDLTDKKNVYWHDLFGTANNYESSESLGVFKGANTYSEGFCRPTEDGSKSIMHYNKGCFNAISRRQILYRLLRLSGEKTFSYGSPEELANFLSWDKANFVYPTGSETRATCVEEVYPLDPPIWVKGSWVDGHFIENEVIEK